MSYKKVNRLKPHTAAYIAGIVDGEGTITLTRKNKDANRRIAVTISNTEYPLLSWVKKALGVGQIISKKKYYQNHAPAYSYQIYSGQALNLLEQIVGYLQTHKKMRAKVALKNYKKLTPRNGKYSPELLQKREEFISNFLEIRFRRGKALVDK